MAQQLTAFEKKRQELIARNKARMAELGLAHSAQMLREAIAVGQASLKRPRAPRAPAAPRAPRDPNDTRRSGRNAGQPAPCYNEHALDGIREGTVRTTKASRREFVASAEEAYTEADLQRLGDHTETWELFKDGFGADGKRIYCQVNGKTCHQCRQKTLGHHTSCSQCQSKRGQFCGDCLYMRYGENVLEVAQNPDWKCPRCRDVCNCSFCRTHKGWAPTGALYPRARQEELGRYKCPLTPRPASKGYKSVAHYLMLTSIQGRDVVAECAAATAKPAAATAAPAEPTPAEPTSAPVDPAAPPSPARQESRPARASPKVTSQQQLEVPALLASAKTAAAGSSKAAHSKATKAAAAKLAGLDKTAKGPSAIIKRTTGRVTRSCIVA